VAEVRLVLSLRRLEACDACCVAMEPAKRSLCSCASALLRSCVVCLVKWSLSSCAQVHKLGDGRSSAADHPGSDPAAVAWPAIDSFG
jgi:hypothetical protein